MDKLPTPVETSNGLNVALDMKAANITSLNAINQKLAEARKALVKARNDILNEYSDITKHPDGQKELGSNEASRSAALDSMTSRYRDAVEALEIQLTKAQGELAVAQIEVDRWRYSLRLLEAQASLYSSSALSV